MSVALLECMGDDLSIVNAAKVSFGAQSQVMGVHEEGIIRYMMANNHGTPFEHVVFKFRVVTSIAVSREWFRHRIASYNEISTRYAAAKEKFHVPNLEDVRTQIGKPGHYKFEPLPSVDATLAIDYMLLSYTRSYQAYERLLELGVAKELARNVLPLGTETQFIMTVNARSLLNFLALRTHPTALLEIRKEALEIEAEIKDAIPITYNAWNEFGRPVGDKWHDCDSMCELGVE